MPIQKCQMKNLVTPVDKSYPIGAQFVSNSSTSLPTKTRCVKTAVKNFQKKKISSNRRMASSALGAEPAGGRSPSARLR